MSSLKKMLAPVKASDFDSISAPLGTGLFLFTEKTTPAEVYKLSFTMRLVFNEREVLFI